MSSDEAQLETQQEADTIAETTETPPPSRTTSDASDGSNGSDASDHADMLTEYHVTSAKSESDEEKEVKKILESDMFRWKEMSSFHTVPSVTQEEQNRSTGWDSPNEDEMPPLVPVSDSEDLSQESEVEDDESEEVITDTESDRDDLLPSRRVRPYPNRQEGVPSLIYLLGFIVFVLHMIHFAMLLKNQRERSRNPCFEFEY